MVYSLFIWTLRGKRDPQLLSLSPVTLPAMRQQGTNHKQLPFLFQNQKLLRLYKSPSHTMPCTSAFRLSLFLSACECENVFGYSQRYASRLHPEHAWRGNQILSASASQLLINLLISKENTLCFCYLFFLNFFFCFHFRNFMKVVLVIYQSSKKNTDLETNFVLFGFKFKSCCFKCCIYLSFVCENARSVRDERLHVEMAYE